MNWVRLLIGKSQDMNIFSDSFFLSSRHRSSTRKFDIEAWMPGRSMYGEISSCSNCTDYQARRLDIRCNDEKGNVVHAHTVNGTACAIPRMLIALIENFQNEDGTIDIPLELQRFMDGKTQIQRTKVLPELKLVKSINESGVQ